MGRKVSLYELKQRKNKDKGSILTDGDYFLRDKDDEAELGYPNTLDMTPAKTQEQMDAENAVVQAGLDANAKALATAKIQAEEDAKLDLEKKKCAAEAVEKMMAGKKAAAAKRSGGK